jgi:hypothetical protein
LVLTTTIDREVLGVIEQYRQAGKSSICEVNDFLPDAQAWTPPPPHLERSARTSNG